MKASRIFFISFLTCLNSSFVTAQQSKPGDVAPNAKTIEADNIFPFYMGAAVIQKGNSYALIDKDGNFIVPYKPGVIVHLGGPYGKETNGGLFTVNGLNDIINSKGKLITEGLKGSWGPSEDGKLIVTNLLCIDENGQKYTVKEGFGYIVDGIGIFREPSSNKIGYKSIKDEWIVKPVYDEAEPFSDGMACVGKKNEFGEMKYGFIDKTGKEVIPLMYSRKPENFYGGLARVEPKVVTDFREAYIDKSGSVVKKFSQLSNFVYFGNGLYSQNMKYTDVMDSTGSIISKDEFLQRFGVSPLANENLVFRFGAKQPMYNSDKIYYLRNKKGEAQKFGFIDLKTKAVVEGTFETYITAVFNFSDPVSKLSRAQFNISGKQFEKTAIRKGYINEQGIFVIVVKGANSEW